MVRENKREVKERVDVGVVIVSKRGKNVRGWGEREIEREMGVVICRGERIRRKKERVGFREM